MPISTAKISGPPMPSPRLPLPAAYIDLAFQACLHESINTPELVAQFDRLYGATLVSRASPIERAADRATGKTEADMRTFVEFVHDCIYLRLPADAIEALRATFEDADHA